MDENKCGGCRFAVPIYIGDGDELLTACVYILRTGRRRPCPPGALCQVYEPAGAVLSDDIRRKWAGMDIYSQKRNINP